MNGSQRLRFLTTIPAINTNFNDVCKIQSVQPGSDGIYTAHLNGTIGNDFFAHGYGRTVMIKSHGDDLSTGEFTVRGFQNGAAVTVGPLVGPAANATIDTGSVFDTITSIEVTDDLLGSEFSATGGLTAIARPFFLNWSNPNTNLMSYGLSVRNPAERVLVVLGAQVFTAGVPLDYQATVQEVYGLFSLEGGSPQAYIYRGFPGPDPEGTSVSYPLWDAFIVAVTFVIGDDTRPTVIAFPQIGR